MEPSYTNPILVKSPPKLQSESCVAAPVGTSADTTGSALPNGVADPVRLSNVTPDVAPHQSQRAARRAQLQHDGLGLSLIHI